MDPVLLAALAEYFARNCSGDIRLSCGPQALAPAPRAQCPPSAEGLDCATYCPEPDYSDPDQPYFWDHATMRN